MKKCPFCKLDEYILFGRSDEKSIIHFPDRDINCCGVNQMVCMNCGAKGPETYFGKEEAEELWNLCG